MSHLFLDNGRCKFCGAMVTIDIYYHIFRSHICIPELSPMVFVWDNRVDIVSTVNGNEITHTSTSTVKKLHPQLMFLIAFDMKSFSINLRNNITIDGVMYIADGVMFQHYDEYYSVSLRETIECKREEFSKLLLTSQYKCVFCELEYDCGMPCIEIVADHVTMRCKASKVTGAD